MKRNPILSSLAGVTVGLETSFENLTMFPLLARERSKAHGALDYLLLDDALASGVTEITEVPEGGSVPELLVVNRGAKPVLIVDGEELVGAKQNRIVNLTILVPADTTLRIPVSCVEAGRWRARSRAFAAAPRTQYASGRARRMMQVTRSLHERGEYVSDQAAVWSDIAAKSARLRASSPTSAMAEIFTAHAPAIEKFVEVCQPFEQQIGALFAIDCRIVGCDVFDRPSTFRRILPKLVRSVAVEAVDVYGDGHTQISPQTIRADAERFLAAIAGARHREANSVGLGTDVRFDGTGVIGAALVVRENVLHLSGFNQAAFA
jgi:ARG/rhodanese/phosphatase superfamily protein